MSNECQHTASIIEQPFVALAKHHCAPMSIPSGQRHTLQKGNFCFKELHLKQREIFLAVKECSSMYLEVFEEVYLGIFVT